MPAVAAQPTAVFVAVVVAAVAWVPVATTRPALAVGLPAALVFVLALVRVDRAT